MSKFESSRLNREFKATKSRFKDLFEKKVLIGVSGGADSMCLLYLLHRHGIETVVVHCNYRLRGESSDKDQKLVEEICSLWGFDCVSVRLDREGAENQNVQSWARDERYRIFREIKTEESAGAIMTAHHEDDQLETIFQKILRGSGIGSWKGMKLIEGDLFRPLLHIPKSAIMEFVQEFNIPYRIDSSNEESTYARNFIRNNWFPELNRLFPGWKENLLRVQSRSAEFDKMADALLQQLTRDEGTRLIRNELLNMDRSLWPVIIHRFLENNGYESNISRGFLLQLSSLSEMQTGKSIQISDSARLLRDRAHFVIAETEIDRNFSETVITVDIPEDGLKLNDLLITQNPWNQKILDHQLQLDYARLNFPLILRNWKDGDLIRPLGMKGSQLVSDHLTNLKVAAIEKREAKVLTSFDGIVYAVIFPSIYEKSRLGTISEAVKCGPSTKQTLNIRKI